VREREGRGEGGRREGEGKGGERREGRMEGEGRKKGGRRGKENDTGKTNKRTDKKLGKKKLPVQKKTRTAEVSSIFPSLFRYNSFSSSVTKCFPTEVTSYLLNLTSNWAGVISGPEKN
jgi:hypothetical protein